MPSYRVYEVEAGEAKFAAIVADLHARLFPTLIFPYPHYGDWWVAWHGDVPVAFSHQEPTTYYPNSGYFGRVGVLPGHRGHGLQMRLMRAGEWKAKRVHGWEALYSDTTRNPHSAANLRKLGWVEFDPNADKKVGWQVNRYTKFWRKEL